MIACQQVDAGNDSLLSLYEIRNLPVYKEISTVKLGSFDTHEQFLRSRNSLACIIFRKAF